MAKSGQPSPRELRQAVLALSDKQAELRRLLVQYRLGRIETLNALAKQANTTGQALKMFLDGNLVLSTGRGLFGLCELLQRPELAREIADLAEMVGPRYLGFANRAAEVIVMAFDLIEYYYDKGRSEKYAMAEFAAVFGDDAEIVLGVLGRNPAEIAVLGDERTRERLTQVLIDNQLDEHLEAARERFAAERRQAAARLKRLVDSLTGRTNGVVQLARMLDTPRNTLYYAITGQASLKTINELTTKVEKLAEMMGSQSPAPATRRAAAEESPAEEPDSVPGISAELESLGGETIAGGVKHVLTEQSFRDIETVALVDLRDMLIRHIPVVRLLLNYGSQLTDDTARAILREDDRLAREIRELLTAIQIFTFQNPHRLLKLYDSERAQIEQESSVDSSRRKGKK